MNQSIVREKYLASKKTYDDALNAFGVTRDEAWAYSDDKSDQIPFEVEPAEICISDSPIHGKGVFAKVKIKKGTIIAPARIGGKRTPVGRYGNHGSDPNSIMAMRENGDVDLVAIQDIDAGAEILSDYFFNFVNTRLEHVQTKCGGN